MSEWVQVTPLSLGDWLSDWMSDRWLNVCSWTVVSWWLVAWLSQWMNEWMSHLWLYPVLLFKYSCVFHCICIRSVYCRFLFVFFVFKCSCNFRLIYSWSVISLTYSRSITHYFSSRLLYRPMSLDLEDPQNECPSGSLMQPISAMIEPITDTLRRRLWTWTPPFDQSALTSAVRHAAGFHRKHDQPDFRRWKASEGWRRRCSLWRWKRARENKSSAKPPWRW